MNEYQCHICGTEKVRYVHTVHDVKRPWLMVNVGYCEACANMTSEIEASMGRCVIAHRTEDGRMSGE